MRGDDEAPTLFPIKMNLLNSPSRSHLFETTMIKSVSILALLPAAAIAFQYTAPIHSVSPTPGITSLVDRADECATRYEFCNIDELETLADGEQRC
jgi:hypothetical protein